MKKRLQSQVMPVEESQQLSVDLVREVQKKSLLGKIDKRNRIKRYRFYDFPAILHHINLVIYSAFKQSKRGRDRFCLLCE